jgi:superfamily II DNA or RNA helicase
MKPKTTTSSKRTASAQAQTDFERILAQHADDQKPWFHFEKLIRDNLVAIYETRGHRFSDVKLTTAGTPGIDHFATDENGQRWAIQTKLYNSLYYVSEPDVASFIAHSKRLDYHVDHMLLVATTNRIGRNAQKLINNTPGFHTLLLEDLGSYDWTDEQVQPVERYELRHDQPRALRHILAGFEHFDKGRYISPPGSGKTLVGLKVAEGLDARVTLVLESSIGLLDQVEREWLEQADPAKPLQSLRVYSQKEVDDDLEEYAAQRMAPATTNSVEIADWVLAHPDQRLVIFTTYHSSPRVFDAVEIIREANAGFEFDFINADEAHRTTGIDDDAAFKTVHKISAKKALFQTATQRVTDPNGSQTPIIAMDDEGYYGPEFYHLNFGRAVDEHWLTDYKPLIPIITPDTILSLIKKRKYVKDAEAMLLTDGRSLACAVYLLKTIWEYDRRKIISFHNSRKSAIHFMDTVLPSAAKWLGVEAPLRLYIDGTKTRGEKAEIMGQFRDAAGPAVIANVRVLTEGIDTPSADGVIFVDPKRSQIDIAQAVGRALRKSDGKVFSLVMIPAFTDSLDDYEEALHKGEFAEVAAIVRQMGFDERIEAKIRLATQQGPWKPPLEQLESAEWAAEDVAAHEWSEATFLAVFDRKRFMRKIPEGTICQVPCGCPNLAFIPQNDLFVCEAHYRQGRAGKKYSPLRRQTIPEGTMCQVPCDCSELAVHVQKGLFVCHPHLQQKNAGQEYTPIRQRIPKVTCQVPCGCSKPADHAQNDLFVCDSHYYQGRHCKEYTPLRRRIPKGATCQVRGCDKPARATQNDLSVCQAHYRQGHVGEEYSPLRNKLTEADVIEVRRRFPRRSIDSANAAQLAQEYGASTSTIRSIVYGKTWKHVPMADER